MDITDKFHIFLNWAADNQLTPIMRSSAIAETARVTIRSVIAVDRLTVAVTLPVTLLQTKNCVLLAFSLPSVLTGIEQLVKERNS